jgi:hypothetical protein
VRQCFRYVSKGKRLLKNQQLIEELEKSLDDKVEKEKLVEGFLGYIICSTQVIYSHPALNGHVYCSSAAKPMLHLLSTQVIYSQ